MGLGSEAQACPGVGSRVASASGLLQAVFLLSQGHVVLVSDSVLGRQAHRERHLPGAQVVRRVHTQHRCERQLRPAALVNVTCEWIEQQWSSGGSNYHTKIRDDMTSSFDEKPCL
jgi:hypothetical protein